MLNWVLCIGLSLHPHSHIHILEIWSNSLEEFFEVFENVLGLWGCKYLNVYIKIFDFFFSFFFFSFQVEGSFWLFSTKVTRKVSGLSHWIATTQSSFGLPKYWRQTLAPLSLSDIFKIIFLFLKYLKRRRQTLVNKVKQTFRKIIECELQYRYVYVDYTQLQLL